MSRMSVCLSVCLSTLLVLAVGADRARAQTQCCALGPMGPSSQNCNVEWVASDSIAGCPAGDSLVFSHSSQHLHPSRMRVYVYYEDNNCNPKVGVPPDSIYVTYSIVSGAGNLKVNDQGVKTYADAPTNAEGKTWITIPSFSGCGKVRLFLTVSGKSVGYVTRVVRTVDTDASGRAQSADYVGACDVNYDSLANGVDLSIISSHLEHWHRNVLHGTLVQRTTYGAGTPGSLGGGLVYWSPSGRYITFGGHPGPCKIFVVASDPMTVDGDDLLKLTYQTAPVDSADYDPSWSPLNHEFAFGRGDNTIYRKGLPWSADTLIHLVTHHDDGPPLHRGDVTGAISPDGKWVAFTRRTFDAGPYEIHKIPINGDETQLLKLTSLAAGADWYPQWSPDGGWIIFQRETGSFYSLYKVRADGGSNLVATPVFDVAQGKDPNQDAATPSYSPDNLILLTGYGPRVAGEHVTHTMDPALSIKIPFANFAAPQFSANLAAGIDFPLLSPRLSADGTRLVLGSQQIWAARRNMSLPPRITSVGGVSVGDTAATVGLVAFTFGETYFNVTATDPENDPITCGAAFLQPWMSFNPSLCRLTVAPSPSQAGQTFTVKLFVTTKSGGTDAILALITVDPSLSPMRATALDAAAGALGDGPNPTPGRFAITTLSMQGATATLTLYDISGRRVGHVQGPAGLRLVWDGRDLAGALAPAGIYSYQVIVAGRLTAAGRIVVVR